MKYCQAFPGLFYTLQAARRACVELFDAVPSDTPAAWSSSGKDAHSARADEQSDDNQDSAPQ